MRPWSVRLSVTCYRKDSFYNSQWTVFSYSRPDVPGFGKTFPKQSPFFSRPGMGNWRHANVLKRKVHFGNLYRRLQPFQLLCRWTSYFKGLNLSNFSALCGHLISCFNICILHLMFLVSLHTNILLLTGEI
jgi:hypothetical protein